MPNARIISVEYDTQLTDWAAVCPVVPATARARTLKKRVCILSYLLNNTYIGMVFGYIFEIVSFVHYICL